MCTVVFIPGTRQHYFASLRDEDAERPTAKAPDLYTEGGMRFLAPKDGLAGGTWLGINEIGNVIILLNGGFEKHAPGNDYRKSRGLIVPELLSSDIPVVHWQAMALQQIEPFTLVVWSNDSLFQLVWDGEQKNQLKLNTDIAYIWSSSTLYSSKSKAYRKKLFEQWMENIPAINRESLLSFFWEEADAENGFIINRNGKIKTLSYSFISIDRSDSACIHYYDFIHHTVSRKEITLVKREAGSLLRGLSKNYK